MTPSRPYLLKALNDWILANDMTPHVVIDANFKGAVVPREHVENGQIILCIAPQSVHELEIENDYISFAAKFSGVSRDIYLPIMSITAIYAEENRKGMVFADEAFDSDADGKNEDSDGKSSKENAGRPKLKIVASNPDLDLDGKK